MLPKYEKIELKNGFEVYCTNINEASEVVSVDLYYKVGSRDEILGKTGIAHMLEHMNFKSTKNHKAGEFDKIVKGFGGVNNASTGFDYTHYFIKCQKTHLKTCLELFSDMLENLSLKNSEFQSERNVVAEERRWCTDNNPIGYLYFKIFENAFSYHPYHWLPIGFYNDIINWKLDDIKKFWQIYYQPKNAFLMISGACDKNEVFDLSQKYFGQIKNKTSLPEFHFNEPQQNGQKDITIIHPTSSQMCAIAFKTPKFDDKDNIALDALAQYLGEGKSSLLYNELVQTKNIASQVMCFNMPLKDAGLFIIVVIANAKTNAKTLKKEILSLINQLKNDKIPEDEVEKIKNSLKVHLEFSLLSASSTANLFGKYIANNALDKLYDLEENTKNLQSKEIQQVAKKYLIKQTMTSIILKAK